MPEARRYKPNVPPENISLQTKCCRRCNQQSHGRNIRSLLGKSLIPELECRQPFKRAVASLDHSAAK
jgi:hypothetical protein